MQRFILTGAPGAGKTTLVERLEELGYEVVREGFMDLYHRQRETGWADPFADPDFIDKLVALQAERLEAAGAPGERPRFFDRSPLCTLALNELMGKPPTERLRGEIDRMLRDEIYDRRVLFVQNLGWVETTEIRTLDYEQTLAFEDLHRKVYVAHGFECVDVPAAEVDERVRRILDACGLDGTPAGSST